MEPKVFDTIILGAGPAGMTATIYAARRKMKALLLCGKVGGQMMWSSDIENYTGVTKATGPELTKQFYAHISCINGDKMCYDLWVREHEKAKKIVQKGGLFEVSTEKQQKFKARTLVVATGKIPRTLQVPGEETAMQGNGLSFCATCDAPLYQGKKMAIIGGGNSAMDVAVQLLKFTDSITIFTDRDRLIGEGVLIEKVKDHPRVHVEYNVEVKEILLKKSGAVRGVSYIQNGNQKEFACEGIFEEIGQIPATDFLEGVTQMNKQKEIITDRRCRSRTPGIFAAGDCTNQAHKQVIVAAGEGAIAALEAHEYLLRQEGNEYAS